MITVSQLGKRYGDLVAVDDVTFTAEPGTIFGLLGPNGAGKSTTIGCISGLLEPTSGRITVLGHDVVTDSMAARRQLGIVPQELALYEDLSARENLSYWGAAYGMGGDALKRRVLEVLELLGLVDRAKEPVKRFSGGMKRRLNFGCGIVHSPKVLTLALGVTMFHVPIGRASIALVWATFAGGALFCYFVLIQLFATSMRGGQILSSMVVFPLIMMGGSFFPFELMPAWMAGIGRWTPNGLAVANVKQIMFGRLDVGALAVAATAIGVGAMLAFFLSVRRLRGTFAVS